MADEKNILKNGERMIGVAAEQGRFQPRKPAAVFGRHFLGSCILAAAVGCGGAVKQEPQTAVQPRARSTSIIQGVAAEELPEYGLIRCSVERIYYDEEYGAGSASFQRMQPTQEELSKVIEDLKARPSDSWDITVDSKLSDICLIGKVAQMHPEFDYSAAVPELVKLLEDPEERVRAEAEKALGTLGDPSVFVISMKKGNVGAIEKIIEKNPGYKETLVPSLAEQLESGSLDEKVAAASLLKGIAKKHPELDYGAAIPELAKMREGKETNCGDAALDAFSQISRAGSTATGIPAWIGVLGSKDDLVRLLASRAIGEFYPKEWKGEGTCIDYEDRIRGKYGKKGLEVFNLINGKRTSEDLSKKAGIGLLEVARILDYIEWLGLTKLEYPEGKRPVFPAPSDPVEAKRFYLQGHVRTIARMLKSENWQERDGAAMALGEIKDGETEDALRVATRDKEEKVRLSAVKALGKFGGGCQLFSLSLKMSDKSDDMRYDLVHALKEIVIRSPKHEDAEFAVDSIMSAGMETSDKYCSSSEMAIEALGDIAVGVKGKNNKLYEKIFSWVKGQHIYSEGVVNALGNMGDRRAVPTLIGILEREDDWDWNDQAYTWDMICNALGMIGDPRATEIIARGLSRAETASFYGDFDEKRRIMARMRWALEKMGDDAVLKAFAERGPEVRRGVVLGMAHMHGERIVPALIGALGDEDREVKQYARRALKWRLSSEKASEETKAEIRRALDEHGKNS